MALADARLQSATERLGLLATEHYKLTTALTALGALAGMEEQVAAIRARLTTLDEEQADLTALQAQAASRRGSASERAAFLRQMYTARNQTFDFATGALSETGAPTVRIGATCSTAQAAALLGCTEAEVAARVPTTTDRLNDGTVEEVLLTRDVVEQLLRALPRDELRALLRRLQAVVLVSRPRPRAERGGKWTPPEDRVALQLLRSVEVRTDGTQGSTSV
jgi:hypothetical protein